MDVRIATSRVTAKIERDNQLCWPTVGTHRHALPFASLCVFLFSPTDHSNLCLNTQQTIAAEQLVAKSNKEEFQYHLVTLFLFLDLELGRVL